MNRFFKFSILFLALTTSITAKGASNLDAWDSELDSCYKIALQNDPNASAHPCKRKLEKKWMGTDVVRNGSDLVISLKGGNRKILSDACKHSGKAATTKCSVEDVPFYTYVIYLPSIAHHLVHVEDSMETESIVLIDSYSGEERKIQSSPAFSPDGKSFVTASLDLFAGFKANGLEIWTLQDSNRLVKQASIDIVDWGPTQPVWINQNLIKVKQMCPIQVPASYFENGTAGIVFRKGEWSLEAKKCSERMSSK